MLVSRFCAQLKTSMVVSGQSLEQSICRRTRPAGWCHLSTICSTSVMCSTNGAPPKEGGGQGRSVHGKMQRSGDDSIEASSNAPTFVNNRGSPTLLPCAGPSMRQVYKDSVSKLGCLREFVMEENTSTYFDGLKAWRLLSPFLWEQAVIKGRGAP